MTARGSVRLALAAAALLVTACGGAKSAPPDATYTLRGEVVAVAAPGAASGSQNAAPPGGEVTIHHEAVPAFKDRDGKPSPMGSMTMGFPPAPGVDISAIRPGDKVEFTFELRWEGNPPTRMVKIVKLPPATALDFTSGEPHLEPVAPLGPGAPAITPEPGLPPAEPMATPPRA